MLIYCKLTKKEITTQAKALQLIERYGKEDAIKFATQILYMCEDLPRNTRLAWQQVIELIKDGRDKRSGWV